MTRGYLGNIYNSGSNRQYYSSNNQTQNTLFYDANNNVYNQRVEENFMNKKTKTIIIWVILTLIILFILIEVIGYVLYKLKIIP